MSDTETLLRLAILANPDEDTPRLMLADYWDEVGQSEHGELIRVQVALANWPCECDTEEERVYHDECRCKERGELRRRERELHTANWSRWWVVDELKPFYTRGFVSRVTCTWEDWLKHGDAILAAEPVREVTLTTEPALYAVASHHVPVSWNDPTGKRWKRHV